MASRVLLAVFLPMLFLSSLHIHPAQLLAGGDDCAECVNHHCGGHIGQQAASMHDCVLCQFLTLPVVVAVAALTVVVHRVCAQRYVTSRQCLIGRSCDASLKRGPPASIC